GDLRFLHGLTLAKLVDLRGELCGVGVCRWRLGRICGATGTGLQCSKLTAHVVQLMLRGVELGLNGRDGVCELFHFVCDVLLRDGGGRHRGDQCHADRSPWRGAQQTGANRAGLTHTVLTRVRSSTGGAVSAGPRAIDMRKIVSPGRLLTSTTSPPCSAAMH